MRCRRTRSEAPRVDSDDHSTSGRPVAEQILGGCLDSLLATPLPTLLTWPRMDIEPAEERPEAEVEEAKGTEPTPFEEVRLGTSGGMSSFASSSSLSSSSTSRKAASSCLRCCQITACSEVVIMVVVVTVVQAGDFCHCAECILDVGRLVPILTWSTSSKSSMSSSMSSSMRPPSRSVVESSLEKLKLGCSLMA